jgi:hypothetical protein
VWVLENRRSFRLLVQFAIDAPNGLSVHHSVASKRKWNRRLLVRLVAAGDLPDPAPSVSKMFGKCLENVSRIAERCAPRPVQNPSGKDFRLSQKMALKLRPKHRWFVVCALRFGWLPLFGCVVYTELIRFSRTVFTVQWRHSGGVTLFAPTCQRSRP